jgi:signal transduction histidine kinase
LTLAEEKERKRLASDLHDNIGQIMVTLKMKLQELKELNTFPALEKHIGECLTLTVTALQQTRSLTFELNPPVLYQLGFIQSLKWLVSNFEKEYNITITLEDDSQPKLIDDEIRFLLFRSIRELLMNVVKHAKASNIKICTLSKNGHLQVTVADDGIGFNVSELNISNPDNTAGYGLFSIRERVLHYGGEFTIESHSDRGTHVILILPLSGSEKTEKD